MHAEKHKQPFPNRFICKWKRFLSLSPANAKNIQFLKYRAANVIIGNILMELSRREKAEKFINAQIARRFKWIDPKSNNVKNLLMKFVPLRFVCESRNRTVSFFCLLIPPHRFGLMLIFNEMFSQMQWESLSVRFAIVSGQAKGQRDRKVLRSLVKQNGSLSSFFISPLKSSPWQRSETPNK